MANESERQLPLALSRSRGVRTRLSPPVLAPQDVSLEEKMSELDVNNDEELKFGEYWRLIGELAKAMRREKAGKK